MIAKLFFKTNKILVLRISILSLSVLLSFQVYASASLLTFLQVGERIWSIQCGTCSQKQRMTEKLTLRQPYFVTSVVWSPDGKYLSIGSLFETNIEIYDTSSWREISHLTRQQDAGNDNSVIDFSDGSNFLILPRIVNSGIGNQSVQEWNILKSSIGQTFYTEFDDPKYNSDPRYSLARAVAASPDGKTIAASVSGDGGMVIVYTVKDSRIIQRIKCQYRNVPTALSFSPDSRRIAVGGCHMYKVTVYNVYSGQPLQQTQVDSGSYPYNFISYNPTGSLIAVGSSDLEFGTITILKASDGSILETLPREHATVTSMQWLKNRDYLLVSYDAWHPDGSIARVWDVESKAIVAEFGGNHLQISSLNPNGSVLASAIGSDVIISEVGN